MNPRPTPGHGGHPGGRRQPGWMRLFLFSAGVCALASAALALAATASPPAGVQTGYVEVEGGRLFYEMAGSGDTVVLLHDGLVHRAIWNGPFTTLATQHHVIRYDRRGYGRSPLSTAPFSHVDDLDHLFTSLGITKATVVGMSAGGGLAVDFTLAHPDKVSGLVLVGAVVSGYGYSSHMMNRGGRLNPAVDLASAESAIAYFGQRDPYEIAPDNASARDAFMQLMRGHAGNWDGGRSRFAQPPSRPAVAFLSEIKVPTLIVVGEHDIPDVHAHAGVLESGIAGSRREIVLEAGHLVPLEQPEAFMTLVSGFLRTLGFYNVLNAQGAAAAVRYLVSRNQSHTGLVLVDEREMNGLGYRYLRSGRVAEAIELFRYNTLAFPNSANVYDSLGEAYLRDGQIDLARQNYEKSLSLDPGNENARQVLDDLRRKKIAPA